MKQGTQFEHLALEVFAVLSREKEHEKVEHDINLEGPDGPRQIDVLITGSVGPFEVKTIVECKDYNKNVNVTAIDALYSKLLDVNAQKAVLVARKGFSSGARKKAKRLGISLCTIHSMEHEKWKFQAEIPLILVEQACEKITPSMIFKAISTDVNPLQFMTISDIPISKVVADYWNNNELECEEGLTEHVLVPDIPKPHWVYVPDGRKMEVTDLKIKMHITKQYYFGYANNLKTAKYIEFVEEEKKRVLFNPSELSDYRDTMTKYYRIEDVPQNADTISINIKLMREEKYNKINFAQQAN
jgi:hypothetical protein